MSNMDHSSHGTSTSSGTTHTMNMAFHTSITDVLFSESWAPKTTGQYAGACIFLIILAIIHRFLVAYKSILDAKWHKQEKNRAIVVAGVSKRDSSASEKSSSEKDAKKNGEKKLSSVDNESKEAPNESPWTAPWRFSTEVPRAGLSTVVSGVGYLLMLAVMSFNVGYFLSVLAGIFVGELAFGRIHKHGSH